MKQFYKGIYFLIIILSISITWGQDCDEGYVPDCSEDGDCCPENWIGDGYCDDENQTWGCDLICYEEEWSDCASFPQIFVYPIQIFQELEQDDFSTVILTIGNEGTEILEWFISNQNDISNWLSLDTYSGFLNPGTLEEVYATFNSLDLDEGEYNTDIFISSNDPFNEQIIIPVTIAVFNECNDGDLNFDGTLDVQDIILMISYLLNDYYTDCANMNTDELINIQDIIILVNIILNN